MNIQQAIQERRNILDEDNIMLDKAWRDMVDACAKDVPSTVAFIRSECTADDMNFLSEVFDELIYQIQSPELTASIVQTALQYPGSDKRYFLQVLDESVSDLGDYTVLSAYRNAKETDSQ